MDGWGMGRVPKEPTEVLPGEPLRECGGVFGAFRIRKGGQAFSSRDGAAGPLSRTRETPAPFIFCFWAWPE